MNYLLVGVCSIEEVVGGTVEWSMGLIVVSVASEKKLAFMKGSNRARTKYVSDG